MNMIFLSISVIAFLSFFGQLWIMKDTTCQKSTDHQAIVRSSSESKTITTTNDVGDHEYFSSNGVGRWPNPILVVGLPKAGTVSLQTYFECGNEVNHVNGLPLVSTTSVENYIETPIKVSHYRCAGRFCGGIIQKNMNQPQKNVTLSPLRRTGRHDVYTQLDVEANVDIGRPCYFPQIQALETIHEHHPNSTFILNIRNVTEWIGSIRSWHNMDIRLSKCNIPNFPSPSNNDRPTEEELTKFYNDHISYIRNFVQQHPSHRLVEIYLDYGNDKIGQILEQEFGILRNCWRTKNINPHHEIQSEETSPKSDEQS